MTKLFENEIFKIEQFNADSTPALIRSFTENNITSFNKLMEIYECTDTKKDGFLFVCNLDFDNPIVFQHLVLFCKHYNIIIYGLKKGSRQMIEKKINRHYLALIFVCNEDSNYNDVVEIVDKTKKDIL